MTGILNAFIFALR